MDLKFDYLKIADITKSCELFKKIIDEQGDDKIHIACCKAMKVVSMLRDKVLFALENPQETFKWLLKGKWL